MGNIHEAKLKGEDKICLGVQIPKEWHEKISKLAKKQDLAMSNIVRVAIREYLEKQSK